MTVSAWRIIRNKHQAVALSGEGSALNPGRWNSAGVRMVYAAGSISLAVLEMLVHLYEATTLPDYGLIQIEFDGSLVKAIEADDLPLGWRHDPPPESLKQFGDNWVRDQTSVVLRVPSAITGEPNFLLNPAHPKFPAIQIVKTEPFNFDARLLPGGVVEKKKSKKRT